MITREEKWALRFLKLAKDWSEYSKDPSTKTGSVIVRPDLTIVAIGYNGFAPGVFDSYPRLNNREIKYKLTIHCELNAILSAKESLAGYTLYNWPGRSCSACASAVIKSGIKKIVSPEYTEDMASRWGEDAKLADTILEEAEVENVIISRKWIFESWEAGLHLGY